MEESIKKQEDRIRHFLNSHLHKTICRENEIFIDILEIMMAQEQWLDKLETIQAFKITKKNNCILLQVKVNNCSRWLNVSWRKGSYKKRKEENYLQSAFRQSIYRQISLWKKINYLNYECVQCKSNIKLQVDHKEPSFIQLTTDFLNNINKFSIPDKFNYHKYGSKFTENDYIFKKKWQDYHKIHATFQWLCKKCNLSKNKLK
jgi:hypothetical protein